MTKAAVRKNLNVLMVLLRSVHIHSIAAHPGSALHEHVTGQHLITKHHIFAGSDEFNIISMHWDLPPASVLTYFHDFAGMYNNVSQVVYYNYPAYCKRNPMLSKPDEITSGTLGPLYILPALRQMYPDIDVVYLDCHLDIFKMNRNKPVWLIMDQAIYLVTCDNRVYYSDVVQDIQSQLVCCINQSK